LLNPWTKEQGNPADENDVYDIGEDDYDEDNYDIDEYEMDMEEIDRRLKAEYGDAECGLRYL